MTGRLRVSDLALLHFLSRVGGLDVEVMRMKLADSLARAMAAAGALEQREFTVAADGLRYVVRNDMLVGVFDDKPAMRRRPPKGKRR